MGDIETDNVWHQHIWATWEEPQETSLGKWPGDDVPLVALPCSKTLRRHLIVTYGDKSAYCIQLDTGPFCQDDEDYVLNMSRPRAELYKGMFCPSRKDGNGTPTVPDGFGGWIAVQKSNGAGIDLSSKVQEILGIPPKENVFVNWRFI